jgi:PPK2 family polyphosphate:nucleotide phosphotransferase
MKGESLSLPHRVAPGRKVALAEIDPDDRGPFDDKNDPRVKKQLDADLANLVELQERLFGEQRQGLLVILQAMDTAGKDGVLRRVVGPLDSRGVSVASFRAPTSEDLAHDYLWRIHARAPARGQMVFFNRSHYEDVLVVRVNELVPKSVWKRRYEHIVAFERTLVDEGTRVVKLYLHISKDEQKRRLQERLDDPDKNWKFDAADLKAREQWDAYIEAYQDALERTSTEHAPWWIVPANRKWYRDLLVARLLVTTLEEMDPRYPKVKLDVKRVVIPD